MEEDKDIHVKWNNHQTTLLSVFSSLLDKGNLVDCTIGAEGQYFKAHRVILSACSLYFELLFSHHYEKHPIIILPDVKFHILKALMEFMYSGEVKVPQNKLNTFLKLAETLQVKGLSYVSDKIERRLKRRNESNNLSEQQGITEYQREPRYGTQVEQTEDRAVPHTLKKECTTGINSLPLAAHKCGMDNSNSISTGKIVGESAMVQDTANTDTFSGFQSSSLTQTLTKSSSCKPATILNPVSNFLGSSQFPGVSEGNISEQGVSNESVLSTCSSSGFLGTLEPQAIRDEKPIFNMLPEIKREDPNAFNGHTVEEIVLDDDSDELDYGNIADNNATVAEHYRDTHFVEPKSVLPSQFRCDACGRSYRYLQGLMQHLRYECGKEPQFKCPHCPVRCTRNESLKVHIARHHLYD